MVKNLVVNKCFYVEKITISIYALLFSKNENYEIKYKKKIYTEL